jgi:hypothetical protein
MLYFNREGVDGENTEALEQALRVSHFREDFLNRKALVKDYFGANEFDRSLRNHLTTVITQAAVARQTGPNSIPCAVAVHPQALRTEGVTEQIGEIKFSIGRRPGIGTMLVDVELLFNTNITNRIDHSGTVLDTCLILEPEQGLGSASTPIPGAIKSNSSIAFGPVELPSAQMDGVHTVRVFGVRVNASLLLGGEVIMFAKITRRSEQETVSVLNPKTTVGLCYPGLIWTNLTPPIFVTELGANPNFSLEGSELKINCEWTIAETFPLAFKNKIEEGVGGADTAGVRGALPADHGTRFQIAFHGIPSGVRLFATSFGVGNDRETCVRPVSGFVGQPLRSDKGLAQELQKEDGSAIVVWEWIDKPRLWPWALDSIRIGFAVVANPNSVPVCAVAASCNLHPRGIVPVASSTEAIPRFVQPYALVNAFAFQPMDETLKASLSMA